MRPTLALILILSGLLTLSVAFIPAPGKNPQPCLECHSIVMEKNIRHAPALENCEKCHKARGKTHPVEGVKGFTLVAEVPELCNNCHPAKNDNGNVHTPVAGGKCFSCHDVHSSDNESLLKYPKAGICLECHDADMSGKKSQHRAVSDGNCQSCHDVHQSDFKKQLKSESAELCLNCHVKMKSLIDAKTVHPPFRKNCLICHFGHSSDTLHLLKDKTPDLCFGCHDDIQANIQEAKHPHEAVAMKKNCMNCHSPHASGEEKLLVASEIKTCVVCHNKSGSPDKKPMVNMRQLVLTSTYNHGTISKTGCSGCHLPHGSQNPFILNGSYREGVFISANKENFLICFSCHKTGLVMDEMTETATGFRNGKQNLHYLHIYGSKARTCTSCHNVHGAMNSKLVAEKVPFGSWEMPIRFKYIDDGGSCAPGCHSEKAYKR
jgi:predicted CXXCH cytochrome family protein